MKRVHLIGAGIALAVVIFVTAWSEIRGSWLLSSDLMVTLTGYIIAALTAAKYEATRERAVSLEIEKARQELPPQAPPVPTIVDDDDTTPMEPR